MRLADDLEILARGHQAHLLADAARDRLAALATCCRPGGAPRRARLTTLTTRIARAFRPRATAPATCC